MFGKLTELVYLVTALVPSEIACLASSTGANVLGHSLSTFGDSVFGELNSSCIWLQSWSLQRLQKSFGAHPGLLNMIRAQSRTYLELVYLVPVLVPSETACLASSTRACVLGYSLGPFRDRVFGEFTNKKSEKKK